MAIAGAGRCACLLAALLLLPAGSIHAAEDPDPALVYERGVRNPVHLFEMLEAEAARRGVKRIDVAFDGISFAPPKGLKWQNEFRHYYRFDKDLTRWLDAIDAWRNRSTLSLHAFSTIRSDSVSLSNELWRPRLKDAIDYAWWEDTAFPCFQPATTWVKRYLKRSGKEDDRMLVLLASGLTPESWVSEDTPTDWRVNLRRLGTYWDEEAVGKLLSRSKVPLMVVAPEGRFEDHLPYPELPSLPWATRPSYPPVSFSFELGGALDGAGPSAPPLTGKEVQPDLLIGVRYLAKTPTWFWRPAGDLLFQNDTPSAYGYWPLARTAAITGGRYYFYPFPASRWLDVCPRDMHQINAMAPELVRRKDHPKRHRKDSLLDAMCRAAKLVQSETPWTDGWNLPRGNGGRDIPRNSGWSAYARANKLEERFRPRRKPWDLCLRGDPVQRKEPLQEAGRELRQLLPKYDAAIARLDKALAGARAPDANPAPRSLANARLAKFWFAMSAFHLHALSNYLIKIDDFRPEEARAADHYVITYVPTIRMSDCLDAYDGRTLTAAQGNEHRLEPGHFRFPRRKTQGNLLLIEEGDPDYRAKRDIRSVLKNLDKRLRRRALAMIAAAKVVMKHHAKTPWGWTVYYSEADTFIWEPVFASSYSPVTRPGKDGEKERDTPWTPRGGSSGGGPTTPGGGR